MYKRQPSASAKLSKLNGLLEMSVDRGETLLKIMETIFDGHDRRRADEYYRERGGFRGMKPDEEVLLDWFVDNDSISLDERKSKLPLPEDVALDKRKSLMESLVVYIWKYPTIGGQAEEVKRNGHV